MKIAMVTPYFYPRIGGLENYALGMGRALVADEECVVEVVTSGDRSQSAVDEVGDIKVNRLRGSFVVSNTPIGARWLLDVRSTIGRIGPDIINVHLPVPGIADIAVFLSGDIPCVLTYHNDLVKGSFVGSTAAQFYNHAVLPRTLARCAGVIATSQLYARTSKSLEAIGQKVHIVRPGVDTAVFYPERTARADPATAEIVFVGSLRRSHRHKGLHILLRAFSEVRKTLPCRLRIVGAGDAEPDYRALSEQLGVGKETDFLGAISNDELRAVYSSSDVAVLPSLNPAEGFGMVLTEAQACGTPVIGSRVGGIPEALREGETGLLVPPDDVPALSEALLRLLSDPDTGRRFGQAGHAWVHRELAWNVLARETIAVFRSVLSNRPELSKGTHDRSAGVSHS